MNRLNPGNPLFTNLELQNPNWWTVLVNDKDIYIEIRKENYIDVYYNGGNIVRELRHNGKAYTGKINYKYLLPEKSEYIDYDFSHPQSLIKKSHIDLFNLVSFDSDTLRRIKANISKYYPAYSEKGIQARFIVNSGCFIDSEFAYAQENLRIDLVWLDTTAKKIVLVELKCMGDNRIYTDEICNQLSKYVQFIKNHGDKILSYYKTLFSLKKRLKILSPGLGNMVSLDDYTIEKKPLLLFGDCEQLWIDNNKMMLDNKIKDIAYGTYFYGSQKSSCNLGQPKHKNRVVYT